MVERRLSRPRGKQSRSNFLRKVIGLAGVKAALLRECAPDVGDDPAELANAIKALPLVLQRPRPLEEAISTKPQPPRPDKVKIKGDVEKRMIEIARSDPPEGRDHWTVQMIADELIADVQDILDLLLQDI